MKGSRCFAPDGQMKLIGLSSRSGWQCYQDATKSNFNAKYTAFSTVYSISRVMTKHIRTQKMYAGWKNEHVLVSDEFVKK